MKSLIAALGVTPRVHIINLFMVVKRNDQSGKVSEGSPAGEKTSISELLFSRSNDKMKTTKKNNKNENENKYVSDYVTLDGLMAVGRMENGLHAADFMSCEDVQAEPFQGTFKVQMMRDGNLYMSELKHRIRNRAIFREDNATFSKGQDGRYYFYFSLPPELLSQLPQRLTRQAGSIANKVLRRLILGEMEK